MLPFTFALFPASARAPLDRVPWYDGVLFVATIAVSAFLMLNIRTAAELGWEFSGAPVPVVAAGLVMWAVLMEALRRTGGWSLLLSVLPFTVYPLFAEQRWLGPLKGSQSTLEQAAAYHVLSNESLLGIPIQAFADTVIGFLVFGTALMMTGRRQVLHQPRLRAVRHVPRRRRQGLHLRQRPARDDVRQRRLQRPDRRHHDHPDHEADRLHGVVRRRRSRPAPRPAPCWRRRSWAPPPSSSRSSST